MNHTAIKEAQKNLELLRQRLGKEECCIGDQEASEISPQRNNGSTGFPPLSNKQQMGAVRRTDPRKRIVQVMKWAHRRKEEVLLLIPTFLPRPYVFCKLRFYKYIVEVVLPVWPTNFIKSVFCILLYYILQRA